MGSWVVCKWIYVRRGSKSLRPGVDLLKTKTIQCGKDFFTTVYEDGHCKDMTWAIVNGTPSFIHEDLFIGNIQSTKFRKKTFTIERPR
jgi:hypothetical protein